MVKGGDRGGGVGWRVQQIRFLKIVREGGRGGRGGDSRGGDGCHERDALMLDRQLRRARRAVNRVL